MNVFEFVIKPSNIISSLCYSIFRLEPFDTCSFGCVYCYAQWYRGPHRKPRAKWYVVKEFERLAKKMREKPFFRLATLSEPFQGDYETYKISLRLIEIAKKYEIPLIINTKSERVARPEVLYALASHPKVLVQMSLSSLKMAKVLEPLASSSKARLEAIERLSAAGVPVVVRVQPLIPGLDEDHLIVAEESLRRGARGLIGESIRLTKRMIEFLKEYGLGDVEWEKYNLRDVEGKEPLYHPSKEWRERIHKSLKHIAQRYGAVYADCKESCTFYGLGKDCCLSWLVFDSPKRTTLRELLKGIDIGDPDVGPPLQKALRMHRKKVFKVLKDEELLKRLCQFEI